MESPHSPEAEIGYRVEDLWDIQEPQLSPSEKLNSCFENIPVSSFPPAHPSQGRGEGGHVLPLAPPLRMIEPESTVIEIPSDSSLADTVETLSKHKILSAPVRNVEAPEDASWIDRYIGIVEFAGIAVWLLHQSEVAALKMMAGSAATGLTAGGVAATLGALTLGTTTSGVGGIALASAAVTGATVAAGPAKSGPDAAASMGGSFFESLTSSDFYKNTKVGDISGSFRWAPFLALQKSDSFLTMLLLLSKYRMKSLPVVDLGEGKIENIITQSSVVHMLAECAGLPWFERWGTKKLVELGLPIMKPDRLVKVSEEEPVLRAFQLMRKKGIGGLPVVNESGEKAVGNISIRDVQYLLAAPDIYKDYRIHQWHTPSSVIDLRTLPLCIGESKPPHRFGEAIRDFTICTFIAHMATSSIVLIFRTQIENECLGFMCWSTSTKNFLTAVRNYLEKHQEASPLLRGVITCKRENTIKEIILKLDSEKIHRIYVVDEEENLEGVITLRDIISRLVHEPHGYFGDFFDGVVPLPQNSRV